MSTRLGVWLKTLWPRHLLADLAQRLVDARHPWIRKPLIRWFLWLHPVDLHEAELADPMAYPTFNALFSRALKAGARPVCAAPDSLVAPVDGRLSEFGHLHDGRLLQAKGHEYTLAALLADAAPRNAHLRNGAYATFYLAPEDYHRVHLPLAARLLHSTYVPGRLFSVNPLTARHVPHIYARNERLVCEFDSAFGPFVLVLVGAGFVSGIETRWRGRAPRGVKTARAESHLHERLHFAKGEEAALFRLGSTVIVLLPDGCATWDPGLQTGQAVRMGQRLASLHTDRPGIANTDRRTGRTD
ncbi:MAG TPA: archaetidylserine decarboxylase [Pseudomonadales bacterium]